MTANRRRSVPAKVHPPLGMDLVVPAKTENAEYRRFDLALLPQESSAARRERVHLPSLADSLRRRVWLVEFLSKVERGKKPGSLCDVELMIGFPRVFGDRRAAVGITDWNQARGRREEGTLHLYVQGQAALLLELDGVFSEVLPQWAKGPTRGVGSPQARAPLAKDCNQGIPRKPAPHSQGEGASGLHVDPRPQDDLPVRVQDVGG